jgi:hypothetical protein
LKNYTILILLLAILLSSIASAITTTVIINKNESNQQSTLYLKDMSGTGLIHMEVTPDGGLWIYNSADQEIKYVYHDNGQINIISKK